MDCKNHYGRSGVNTCSKCGDWVCEECTVQVQGRNICKNCIQEYIQKDETFIRKGTSRPDINGFLVFLFSFLPGAAHMYMGLSKIGLMFLTLFIGGFVLAEISALSFFSIAFSGILWVYCFFDARNMKHRIRHGEVKDDITPYLQYVKQHKSVFALVLIVLGGVTILRELQWFINRIFGYCNYLGIYIDKILFAGFFIVVGLWLIATNRKKSNEEEEKDLTDHFNN